MVRIRTELAKSLSILLILLLLFLCCTTFVPEAYASDGSWASKKSMPIARSSLAAVSVDNKIYAIGGFVFRDGKSSATSLVEIYDTHTDSWENGKPLPVAGGDVGAVAVGRRIYVLICETSQFFVFDVNTNEWTELARLPADANTGDIGMNVVGGKIYVARGSGDYPSGIYWTYCYDPQTKSWTEKSPIPYHRTIGSFAELNGKLYAIGGADPSLGRRIEVTRVDIYDPETDTWTLDAIKRMSTPRTHLEPDTPVVNGKIYVIGGWDGYSTLSTVEEYDPATNSWKTLTPMPTARYGLATAVVNGKIYCIGGDSGGYGGNPKTANEELSISVTPIKTYILHVQSSPITGIEISYSGDYSGTGTTNFDIGPKNSPFTVTLKIPYRFGNYRLDYLKIDGKRKGAVETLTITVDDQNKERTVVAVFVPKKFDLLRDGFRFSNSEFTETVNLKLEEIKQRLKSDPVTNKIPEWLLIGLIDLYQRVQYGYCGGMTLAAKYYYENPDKLPNGCLNLIEAQKEDVLDTIVYFQNTQYFIDQYLLKWILVNLGEAPGGLLSLENQISWLKLHVDKGGVAYVDIIGRNEEGNYISHAVLAYDITDDSNKVTILVYGPNRPFESQAIELIRNENGKLQILNGEAYVDYFWISRLAIVDAPTDLDWDYIVDECLAQLIEWFVKQFKKSVDNLVDYFSQIGNTFAIKLQSAAELHVYDSMGRHVGPVEGGTHIGFPSIFYVDEDGTENFILPSPNADNYKVLLVGKTNGHYNLTIFTIRNGALLSKIIKTGNISEGEKQEININISPSGEVKEQTKSPTDHYELWIIAGLLGIVVIITISITIIKKRKSMRHEPKPLS